MTRSKSAFKVKSREPNDAPYIYVDENNRVHLMLPIIAGAMTNEGNDFFGVGTDNTCQTTVEMQKFFDGHGGNSAIKVLSEYKDALEFDILYMSDQEEKRKKQQRLVDVQQHLTNLQQFISQHPNDSFSQIPPRIQALVSTNQNLCHAILSPQMPDHAIRIKSAMFGFKRIMWMSGGDNVNIFAGRLRANLQQAALSQDGLTVADSSQADQIQEGLLDKFTQQFAEEVKVNEDKFQEFKDFFIEQIQNLGIVNFNFDHTLESFKTAYSKKSNISIGDLQYALVDDPENYFNAIWNLADCDTLLQTLAADQKRSPFKKLPSGRLIPNNNKAICPLEKISILTQFFIMQIGVFLHERNIDLSEYDIAHRGANEYSVKNEAAFGLGALVENAGRQFWNRLFEDIRTALANGEDAELAIFNRIKLMTNLPQNARALLGNNGVFKTISERFNASYNTVETSQHFDDLVFLGKRDGMQTGDFVYQDGRFSISFDCLLPNDQNAQARLGSYKTSIRQQKKLETKSPVPQEAFSVSIDQDPKKTAGILLCRNTDTDSDRFIFEGLDTTDFTPSADVINEVKKQALLQNNSQDILNLFYTKFNITTKSHHITSDLVGKIYNHVVGLGRQNELAGLRRGTAKNLQKLLSIVGVDVALTDISFPPHGQGGYYISRQEASQGTSTLSAEIEKTLKPHFQISHLDAYCIDMEIKNRFGENSSQYAQLNQSNHEQRLVFALRLLGIEINPEDFDPTSQFHISQNGYSVKISQEQLATTTTQIQDIRNRYSAIPLTPENYRQIYEMLNPSNKTKVDAAQNDQERVSRLLKSFLLPPDNQTIREEVGIYENNGPSWLYPKTLADFQKVNELIKLGQQYAKKFTLQKAIGFDQSRLFGRNQQGLDLVPRPNGQDNASNVSIYLPETVLASFHQIISTAARRILGQKFYNPYTEQEESFPRLANQFTARHLQILARNEFANTDGIMKTDLYGGLLDEDTIARIRTLAKGVTVSGMALAHHHGGFDGQPLVAHQTPQKAIIVDQSGLQWQGDLRNTGGMFFYPYPGQVPPNYIVWQKEMYRAMYNADMPLTYPENYLDVQWNRVQGRLDLNGVAMAIKNEFLQALESANLQANTELGQNEVIIFRFLKAGMGFFASGLNLNPEDKLRLANARMEGIKQALQTLVNLQHKGVNISNYLNRVNTFQFPFSGDQSNIQIQSEILGLMTQLGIFVDPQSQNVFSNIDALSPYLYSTDSQGRTIVIATTNCGDPHAMNSNEGAKKDQYGNIIIYPDGYPRGQSVDAQIGLNANTKLINTANNAQAQLRTLSNIHNQYQTIQETPQQALLRQNIQYLYSIFGSSNVVMIQNPNGQPSYLVKVGTTYSQALAQSKFFAQQFGIQDVAGYKVPLPLNHENKIMWSGQGVYDDRGFQSSFALALTDENIRNLHTSFSNTQIQARQRELQQGKIPYREFANRRTPSRNLIGNPNLLLLNHTLLLLNPIQLQILISPFEQAIQQPYLNRSDLIAILANRFIDKCDDQIKQQFQLNGQPISIWPHITPDILNSWLNNIESGLRSGIQIDIEGYVFGHVVARLNEVGWANVAQYISDPNCRVEIINNFKQENNLVDGKIPTNLRSLNISDDQLVDILTTKNPQGQFVFQSAALSEDNQKFIHQKIYPQIPDPHHQFYNSVSSKLSSPQDKETFNNFCRSLNEKFERAFVVQAPMMPPIVNPYALPTSRNQGNTTARGTARTTVNRPSQTPRTIAHRAGQNLSQTPRTLGGQRPLAPLATWGRDDNGR